MVWSMLNTDFSEQPTSFRPSPFDWSHLLLTAQVQANLKDRVQLCHPKALPTPSAFLPLPGGTMCLSPSAQTSGYKAQQVYSEDPGRHPRILATKANINRDPGENPDASRQRKGFVKMFTAFSRVSILTKGRFLL